MPPRPPTPACHPAPPPSSASASPPRHPGPPPTTPTPAPRSHRPRAPHPYRRTLTLTTRAAEGPYRQTFREATDGSIQYYGVNPPPAIEPGATYGLALTLHGAGVEGIGQAQAYAPKDDLYLIAPTNRRRFGFDWEAWGRLNGLAALDDALARHPIDPTRVWLTGHSMGGHGTWHLGVTTPGRFAVIGPSAGWASFQSYVGLDIPDGLFGRARAHSRTLDYIDNLTRRAVYIIHGDADDNVPVREGRDMFAAVGEVTDDIIYHEEPGAGHWWDNDPAPGAACVDWPPLFELMRERRLDPFELDFHFRTPGPGYSATHSVVRVEAAITPLEDITLDARRDGDHLELTTHNARALTLDGTALAERGITTVTVDGIDAEVTPDAMPFGTHGQKTAAAHGPLAQAFERPFCFVYAADEPEWRRVAAYWASYWQLVGNGHACGLTDETFTGDEGYRAIRLGAAADPMRLDPFDWDAGGVTVDGTPHPDTALVMVRREGPAHDGPLAAALVAADGAAHLLLQVVPFGSTAGLPDWLVFAADGGRAVGFFDPDWRYDPALSLP
ncbi:MAG: prolyl oligopeptidase family serine peptidase [bacterium]